MVKVPTSPEDQHALGRGAVLPRDGQRDLLERHRMRLTFELENRWYAEEGALNAICQYALEPTGKMLRPMLLIESAIAVGAQPADVLPAAVGAECGHVASLIHDDIIDNDDVRRGKPSVQRAYGVDAAIVAGDMLIFDLFANLAECRWTGVPDSRIVTAMKAVAQAGIDLCQGQFLESQLCEAGDFDADAYLRMADLKTGAFFRAACEIGAILGGGGDEFVGALSTYGKNLGSAFQIRDDLLPFTSDFRHTGKPDTSDVRNGRLILPAILARRLGNARDRNLIEKSLSAGGDATQGLKTLKDVVERTGALTEAVEMARNRARTALGALTVLPHSESRERLGYLADLAVERDR